MGCFYSQPKLLRKITVLNCFKKTVLTNRLTKSMEQTFLDESVGSQLVNKFLLFYEKRRIIAVFTTGRRLPLSSARSVQSTKHSLTSLRSTLIFSEWSLFLRFSNQTLYAHLLPHIHVTCTTHLVLLHLIILAIFVREHVHGHTKQQTKLKLCTFYSVYFKVKEEKTNDSGPNCSRRHSLISICSTFLQKPNFIFLNSGHKF